MTTPEGFKDLSHAFTLFADSNKKADPGKRGRFNLGEKLVLAICDQATISTTKGTIHFEDSERRASRSRRQPGSLFEGVIRMTGRGRRSFVRSQDAGSARCSSDDCERQDTPSSRPAHVSPDGESCLIPVSDWTPAMETWAKYLKRVGEALLGKQLQVDFARAHGANKRFRAWYSPGHLTLNIASAGARRYKDFNDADVEEVDALLVHELAHDRAANHLSDDYHRAPVSSKAF